MNKEIELKIGGLHGRRKKQVCVMRYNGHRDFLQNLSNSPKSTMTINDSQFMLSSDKFFLQSIHSFAK